MGSKHLKAVVVNDPALETPPDLQTLRETYEKRFADSDTGRWLTAGDTLETVAFADETGVLPTRGWQSRRFEGADGLRIEQATARSAERERSEDTVPGGFRVSDITSDGTTDACGQTDTPGDTVPRGGTPIALGAGLGIDDFDTVTALGAVCDRLGLDVISAGNAVAWAIRASERDLIDRKLSFGDEEAARALIEEIATRSTSLGDALADGVSIAAEQFGGTDLIPTVKGMELASYDPRGAETMALAFATSDRGGCHRRARPVEIEAVTAPEWTPEERATVVADEQDSRAALWCLIGDDFLADVFGPAAAAEWLTALGDDCDPDDLDGLGERVWTLVRLFNLREGFTRDDDTLPDALIAGTGGEPGSESSNDGIDPEMFDEMLARYYAQREWDQAGRPTERLLSRLGLADLPDTERLIGGETVGATDDY